MENKINLSVFTDPRKTRYRGVFYFKSYVYAGNEHVLAAIFSPGYPEDFENKVVVMRDSRLRLYDYSPGNQIYPVMRLVPPNERIEYNFFDKSKKSYHRNFSNTQDVYTLDERRKPVAGQYASLSNKLRLKKLIDEGKDLTLCGVRVSNEDFANILYFDKFYPIDTVQVFKKPFAVKISSGLNYLVVKDNGRVKVNEVVNAIARTGLAPITSLVHPSINLREVPDVVLQSLEALEQLSDFMYDLRRELTIREIPTVTKAIDPVDRSEHIYIVYEWVKNNGMEIADSPYIHEDGGTLKLWMKLQDPSLEDEEKECIKLMIKELTIKNQNNEQKN